MEKVKGSVFIYFVKVMRKAKDERAFGYLTDEDKAIVAGKIFPSIWYPIDTFWRCVKACYEVFGERRPANAREWGKVFGIQMMQDIYKDSVSSFTDGDIPTAIQTFSQLSRSFFSPSQIELVSIDSRSAQLRLTQPGDDPAAKIFYFVICGGLEKFVEMAGGENPRASFSEAATDEMRHVVFNVNWQ